MIEFRGVHKAFGDRVVLDGVDLVIPTGETTVILGASGSGKSVLLKHIVGLVEPDQGDVLVGGESVPELDYDGLQALRRRIGFVFQFAALFDSMTIDQNLRLALEHRKIPADEVTERVTESLRLVELEGVEDRYPAELSGGMRKRVGIARAISLRPEYILYDEPTSGLDPVTTAVIDELMMRAREALGITGVVVSHDLRSAFRVGDRVAMLHEGRIREAGTVAAIQASSDPVIRNFIEGRTGTEPAPAPGSRP
ncbi:MAG: ABC transporter ATP-binding protein [Gemmatimonadota bacterium]|nr:ABC transporter ATP-binding protein [Gemmatimonadota bacterium]